ncbi:MAG: hypothetical protein ACFB6R_03180 [Alphaproteobacteria bacterium]
MILLIRFLILIALFVFAGDGTDGLALAQDQGQSGAAADTAPRDDQTGNGTTVEERAGDEERVRAITETILLLGVIAIILESAFTILFNWPLFARFVGTQELKTPLIVGVGIALSFATNVNLLDSALEAYGRAGLSQDNDALRYLGLVLTGILLAGGNDALYNVFKQVNLRQPSSTRSALEAEHLSKARVEIRAQPIAPANPAGTLIDVVVNGRTLKTFTASTRAERIYLPEGEHMIAVRMLDEANDTVIRSVKRTLSAKSDIIIDFTAVPDDDDHRALQEALRSADRDMDRASPVNREAGHHG